MTTSTNPAGNAVHMVARVRADGTGELLGTAVSVSDTQLLTCLHVTDGSDDGLVLIPGPNNFGASYQDSTETSAPSAEIRIDRVDPLRDLCLLRLVGNNNTGTYVVNIGSSDDVAPGSEVVTFGYPHADFGRRILTQQSALVGARILADQNGTKSKQLVLNLQTRPGQSGGPVFFNGRMVAIVLGSYAPNGGGMISMGGVDPATLHTTTHAVSAEYAKLLMA